MSHKITFLTHTIISVSGTPNEYECRGSNRGQPGSPVNPGTGGGGSLIPTNPRNPGVPPNSPQTDEGKNHY